MDSKLIGKRIKERRLELNRTLQEVADSVNVNKSTIQRYESGNIIDVKLPVIESIAKYLNVSPLWIIGKIENKRRSEEYERATHLIDLYFRGIMNWSEDQLFDEKDTVIIREHFYDLLLRYKLLIENTVYAKNQWKTSEKAFSDLYKDRKTNVEIKELFLTQELERNIKEVTDWVNALPNWIARNENENEK